MQSLADILTKDSILLDYNANSLEQALQAIATLASEMSGLRPQTIIEKLSERIAQGVGVGGGVAIPHARFEGLHRTIGFYVRLRVPLQLAGQPVDTMFIMLAPEYADAEHLKALAHVARLLRTPESRDRLNRADSKESVFDLLAAA
ncbi:MAG: PTS sugar transporter subunit IIA [Alphaproteobacteria bacterium]|nr:PTS sugar transporter subunit IIA [Alphaproteobacteria bacterium]